MATPVTRAELEAAHAWENDDRVPGRPAMTEFRRLLRYHQARWREAHGHPIGTQPIAPKAGGRSRPVGSRLPLPYARETGANFVSAHALEAVKKRVGFVERHQSVDYQRLWADLLWSPALACNLFGELAADLTRADRALHAWFPDAPGRVGEVRFLHSPGWLDPSYLNSLRSFDAAFVLELDDGTRGIVGVKVNYWERNKAETPRPENVERYRDVAEASRAFAPGAIDVLLQRNDLCVMYACTRYRRLLRASDASFASLTLLTLAFEEFRRYGAETMQTVDASDLLDLDFDVDAGGEVEALE